MKAMIVNPVHELYCDGKFFADKAKTTINQFEKWRYLRVAIITSFTALEAAINGYWDAQFNRNPRLEQKYFKSKFDSASIAYKWQQFFTYSKGLFNPSDTFWQDFLSLKDLRNNIIHYKGNATIFYQKVEAGIDNCLGSTKDMLTRLYGSATIAEWDIRCP